MRSMEELKIAKDMEKRYQMVIKRLDKTLFSALDMRFVEFDAKCLVAAMPLSEKTRQSIGILHGGASLALAETVASIGAWLNVDETKYVVVGLEINANHIRPVSKGEVFATATPIHIGRKTQVWQIVIRNEAKKVNCVSRCTVAVVPIEDINA